MFLQSCYNILQYDYNIVTKCLLYFYDMFTIFLRYVYYIFPAFLLHFHYMAVSILYPSEEICVGGVPRKHLLSHLDSLTLHHSLRLTDSDSLAPSHSPGHTRSESLTGTHSLRVTHQDRVSVSEWMSVPDRKLGRSRRKLEEIGGNGWEKNVSVVLTGPQIWQPDKIDTIIPLKATPEKGITI